MALPNYVLVGHLCCDLFDTGPRTGGTGLYAGIAALRLGRQVGIVSAHAPDLPVPHELDGADLAVVPSPVSTTFEHERRSGGRALRLISRASAISLEDVPAAWRSAEIVHFAPVAWEVDPSLPAACGAQWPVATAQGWLRRADASGHIVADPAGVDRLPLGALAAVVISEEDVDGRDELVQRIAARCPITAVTRGAAGCTLYARGRPVQIPPWTVEEVDSTGAGDVFAAALFVRLSETADPVESARFASCAAALSVRGTGVTCIPTRAQVEERLWRA